MKMPQFSLKKVQIPRGRAFLSLFAKRKIRRVHTFVLGVQYVVEPLPPLSAQRFKIGRKLSFKGLFKPAFLQWNYKAGPLDAYKGAIRNQWAS
jgi:hypothetical protein